MRDEDVGGEAAIDGDAEMAVRGAQILLAAAARRASAATDPGIDRDAAADGRAVGFVSRGFDHAGDLVSERERQRAVLGDVEPLVAAEQEIAVLQMQVGMAHAAALDAHQHFAAARRGAVDHGLAERLPVGDERLAVHFGHGGSCSPAVSGVAIMPETALRGEGPRQRYEVGDGDILGPRRRGESGGREQVPTHRRRANAGFGAASCAVARTPPGLRSQAACGRRSAAPPAAQDEPART